MHRVLPSLFNASSYDMLHKHTKDIFTKVCPVKKQ